VYVVSLAVHLDQIGAQFRANSGKDGSQSLDGR
jgi:hypothetical protein